MKLESMVFLLLSVDLATTDLRTIVNFAKPQRGSTSWDLRFLVEPVVFSAESKFKQCIGKLAEAMSAF